LNNKLTTSLTVGVCDAFSAQAPGSHFRFHSNTTKSATPTSDFLTDSFNFDNNLQDFFFWV